MSKKRNITLGSLTLLLFALSLAGCGTKKGAGADGINSVQQMQEIAPVESSEVAKTTESTESSETTEVVTEETPEVGTIEYINSLAPETAGFLESDWIAWANGMHQRACTLEFESSSGMNFQYDTSSSIQVNGMEYYLCTNYSSIEEASAEYYAFFTKEGRENVFSGFVAEQDGALYVCPLGRGSDIYYKDSCVVSLDRIEECKVVFSVDNYYYTDAYFDSNGADDSYTTQKNDFSVVFEDGVWKVEEFYLPY